MDENEDLEEDDLISAVAAIRLAKADNSLLKTQLTNVSQLIKESKYVDAYLKVRDLIDKLD